MSPLENYTRNVARRWKVIVAFTVLGAVLATAWLFTTSRTTWTATAALTTQSQERAPEQDAVLALGYVNYFNQESYQELLHSRMSMPADVELEAQTGATSPIMYIMATGRSDKDARHAAALAAETFREDVRASLVVERRRAAADLQAEVDNHVKTLGQRGYNEAVVLDQIRSLQGRITDIQADNTNLLKQLQPEPGVAAITVSPVFGIVAGAGGGLVTGILVALLLALLDRRLRSADDVRQHTGLETLGNLTSNLDAEGRGRVAATVINALSVAASDGRIALAVTAPRRTPSTRWVAMELASAAAGRRTGALLIQADLRRTPRNAQNPATSGLVNILHGERSVDAAAVVTPSGVEVVTPGDSRGDDPQSLLEPGRVVDLVNAASTMAGVVVIELPPVLEAAEAQVLGSAADRVVLVVERGVTSTTDVADAHRLLKGVGAIPAGVILVDPKAGPPDERFDAEIHIAAQTASVDPDDPSADTGDDANATMLNGAAAHDAAENHPSGNGAAAAPAPAEELECGLKPSPSPRPVGTAAGRDAEPT